MTEWEVEFALSFLSSKLEKGKNGQKKYLFVFSFFVSC